MRSSLFEDRNQLPFSLRLSALHTHLHIRMVLLSAQC